MSIRRSLSRSHAVPAPTSPVVMLVMALALAPACQRSGPDLGSVERLTPEARLARYNAPYYVAITALPLGGALVAWMKDESPYRPIVFRRAERADAPFGEEQYLSPEDFRRTISIVPSLQRDATGEVYAAWQARDPRKGDKFVLFRRSRDGGGSWAEARVLNGEKTVFIPSLESDGAGGVYVAWPDERVPSTLQIYFNRSLDGGETWLPAEARIDREQRASAKGAVVATDGAGGVLVVWEQRKGKRAIMAAVSKDRGATWSNPVQVDDGTGRGSPIEPRVAFAGGRMVVAWTTGVTGKVSRGEVWADVSSDGGLTWGKDVLLHDLEGGLVSSPQLVSDGRGVQMVFGARRTRGGSAVYHVALRGDGEWSAHGAELLPVGLGEGVFEAPRLARDSRGVLFLVCADADARVLLTSSKDEGVQWQAPTVVYERADAQKQIRFPQVAVSDGVAYVLWEEWSDSAGRVKTLAETEKTEELPADLFVRRVRERH